MLDRRLVRERPDLIREMLSKRGVAFPLDELLEKDARRRRAITKAQELKQLRNRISQEIAVKKKRGEDVAELMERVRGIADEIDALDRERAWLEREVEELLLRLPNLLEPSVPVGYGEEENVEVRRWGEPPNFDFTPKDHIDLCLANDWIDLTRASKVAGSRFYFLKGELVRMNYALIQLALDYLSDRGYQLIQPPYMLNREAIAGAIMLSDFEDVIYKVEDEDLYLIGTSEHSLVAMLKQEILEGASLPLRYAGVSPCFRKEAGAHGRDTKGIFRVHQFEKVEQFIFSKPQDSPQLHQEMIRNAEGFFRLLGLPYRVVLLCSGEVGKVASKTYDLEVWLPGQGRYREAVSCSNCTDYQARRLGIKYRERPHEEAQFVHTLNSTLVATERTLIAIIENYQERDGRVKVPEALRPYMGGVEVIP